ncbi:MAG: N-6 DNA methylase [Treponema sp.]|jgi:restriction endonuclease S subunit|nr:N-6 DNA methylase [Treponema sp.]
MGRSTVHYTDNDTNNILKRLHNKLRPAGTPVERVEYIIELLLLRIFETKLRQDDVFKPLRKLFDNENDRLLFSYIHSLSNGDRILSELNKKIFPFYATILHKSRKVIKGNLPPKMQDQLVLMEEVFANSNFTNNVKGGVITEVIGLINDIDEKHILKTDLLGDAIESALSETGGTKDLGLYRTPDHIRQMMVAMTDPDFSDTIFDPACGTAGFLFDTYDYMIGKIRNGSSNMPSANIRNKFYRIGIGGIEYQGRIRKMAAVNMYIRGLNPHNIMQGDSLKMYDPAQDAESKTVVIANPPFGAERDQPAYPNVWEEYSKESETTILFVKLMFDYLKAGGRCAVVVSEGFLTWGQSSACALRKMLLNEANLRAIISLPQGVFVSKNGQGAKTSILYFEKGQPTDFVWYYKIENDGFSIGTNRKPIEGSQIPELLKLFQKVKQGKKPKDTTRSFCVDRKQIETLDPKIKEQIVTETREKATERNALKREKKIAELDKKLAGKKISKTVYKKELSQFNDIIETQVENEIAKAVEKAHTYHFNLQNYRVGNEEKQNEYPLMELKNLITINNNRIKPANFPETEFTILGVSKQIGVFVNEKTKGRDIKQSYFRVEKSEFCYNPYRINVGSIGLCELEIENQIISGAYNIFSCDESKLNPKYLDALFKTSKFLDYVNENATGGVRMDFKIEFMQGWKIPLPSLEIQNEIVEKIERQKQVIEGAEKIIKNCELDILSNGKWEEEFLEKLVEVDGSPIKSVNNFLDDKYIGGENIESKTGRLLNVKTIRETGIFGPSFRFKAGHVVYCKIRPNLRKCFYAEFDGYCSSDIYPLKVNTELILPRYLTLIMQSKFFADRTDSFQIGRSGMPKINREQLFKIKIPLPSLEIQHQIIENLDKQMTALESVRFLKAEAEKRIEEILAGMWKGKQPVMETYTAVTSNSIAKDESIVPMTNTIEEKAFLKRKILATYIINQSLTDPNFGDVKFEKLFYLSEYFILKRNFGQNYYVQAAGPYDNKFTMGYFKQVEQSKWFNRRRNGNQYIFSKGEKHDKSLNIYDLFSDDELEHVNMLINYFRSSTYEQPEIVATLYAVWNNRIIKQEPITDELLKEDFLNWDEQKIKYKDRLDNALKWMRGKGIVPDGWGKVIEKANKNI